MSVMSLLNAIIFTKLDNLFLNASRFMISANVLDKDCIDVTTVREIIILLLKSNSIDR